MKAVVLEEKLQFQTSRPTPENEPISAVIRPTLVGICKTDLELMKGYMGFHGVLGHEFVGIVEECSAPEWVGKRVVGEINCSPRDNIVEDPRHQDGRTVLGIMGRDGVMAERFVLPIENLLEVPDTVSDESAVFTEPLAAAYQILEQVPDLPATALVLGDGKLGTLCALALKDLGCQVTLMGKHQTKLDPLSDKVKTQLVSEPLEETFPLVVEATGSNTGLEQALNIVEPKGVVILKTTVADPHQVNLAPIVINEIQLLGSRCGRFAPALDALADGRVDPSFLIEKVYPLDEALAAFEHAARRGAKKVLLRI
jgi:threonine dehydrogenase-like Zn-dependent dehydrogenase